MNQLALLDLDLYSSSANKRPSKVDWSRVLVYPGPKPCINCPTYLTQFCATCGERARYMAAFSYARSVGLEKQAQMYNDIVYSVRKMQMTLQDLADAVPDIVNSGVPRDELLDALMRDFDHQVWVKAIFEVLNRLT